jgi:hypothetical protein
MNLQRFYIGKAIGTIVVLVIALAVAWFLKSEPAQQPDDGWKTMTDSHGTTFRYPEQLSTTYIHVQDWPPQVIVADGPFTCTEAGKETERAGRTEKRMVDNRAYCITTLTEGAAGTIYTQYSYITAIGNNKTVNLIFTIRSVQCGNYDEPQKSQCEGERETFDLDSVIDRIVKTI